MKLQIVTQTKAQNDKRTRSSGIRYEKLHADEYFYHVNQMRSTCLIASTIYRVAFAGREAFQLARAVDETIWLLWSKETAKSAEREKLRVIAIDSCVRLLLSFFPFSDLACHRALRVFPCILYYLIKGRE